MPVPYKPLPITTPRVEVTLTWGLEGDSFRSKLYYVGDLGYPTYERMVTIADFMWAYHNSNLRSVLPTNVFLYPMECRYLGNGADIEAVSTENAGAGTLTGIDPPIAPLMPEQNQVVIQRRTGMAGHANRGRIFLPYVAEKLANDSTLNADGIAKYKAIAVKFSDTITVDGVAEMIPQTPNGKTGQLVQVTQCRVVSEVCSRRDRRNPKRPVYFATLPQYS